MDHAQVLTCRLSARPGAVAQARHAVTELAERIGAHEDDVARVRLAVSEAVTNAVLHAYAGQDGGEIEIEVEASQNDRALSVIVRDFGRGMKPRHDSPGLGLGLPLIAQVADELDVRTNGSTTVQMQFLLAA